MERFADVLGEIRFWSNDMGSRWDDAFYALADAAFSLLTQAAWLWWQIGSLVNG